MKRIHADLEAKDFTKPSDITQATVCTKSGLLPEPDVCSNDPRGSSQYTEYFAAGTAPTETCDKHVALSICKESGEIAGPYCPAEDVETKVFILGAEPGSPEYEYCATEEFMNKICSIHDENYVPDEPDNEPEEDDNTDSDEPSSEDTDDPNAPGDDPSQDDNASEDSSTDLTLMNFGVWRWLLQLHRS